VGLRIVCPNCGERSYTEFWFGGELPPPVREGETLEEEFERVWLKRNVAGLQAERWFHHAGCRRWLTLERDTVTNEILRD
jgi:heterotetrameric sarcosine oxidase delta subunit